ncbi:GNAT family N-acetyltransferase [Cereibacter changlensis]|uniref:GNAT family N-acetyltransferase n=2 Tax=Cereibacter changlensis TaxID=402884 RepID=A0A4U0Z5B4_9RHOB|nr:GNAT family N-acetyltransferase [Cereibacter changlensis]
MTGGVTGEKDMQHWTARPRPEAKQLEGRFVRLERLDPDRHAEGLFDASAVPDAEARFRWLFDEPPSDRASFRGWVERSAQSTDPLFYAVIDRASGKVAGRQTLMRIDTANGVAEIGNIFWGPLMARRPAATEALHLFARHLFDDLGYRRFEWKCNDDNLPSKRAALRFGFRHEGLFRQHMVVKGLNRDTAWFAMTDRDWASLKPAYEAWLSPGNFNAEGTQRQRLEALQKVHQGA